jgi:predicted GIY-YIG superfamily endonuclease
MNTIYILELEDNKYYVGKTMNVVQCWKDHLTGNASYWTSQYKPISIIKVIEDCGDDKVFNEDKYVKEYMLMYGIDNVRGGTYSQYKLSDDIVSDLEKELKTSNDIKDFLNIDDYIKVFKEVSVDDKEVLVEELNNEILFLKNKYNALKEITEKIHIKKRLIDNIKPENIEENIENINEYYKQYIKNENIDDNVIKYYDCIFNYNESLNGYKEILKTEKYFIRKQCNIKSDVFDKMLCEQVNKNVDTININIVLRQLKAVMEIKYLLI